MAFVSLPQPVFVVVCDWFELEELVCVLLTVWLLEVEPFKVEVLFAWAVGVSVLVSFKLMFRSELLEAIWTPAAATIRTAKAIAACVPVTSLALTFKVFVFIK